MLSTPYSEIAEAIIKKLGLVLGESITIERARRVEGLSIGDDGNVKEVTGNVADVLEKLIDQYRELLGPAAIYFAKDAARSTIAQNQDLTLPRSLV